MTYCPTDIPLDIAMEISDVVRGMFEPPLGETLQPVLTRLCPATSRAEGRAVLFVLGV